MAMGISTQTIPYKPSCPPLFWLSCSCRRSSSPTSYTSRSFWAFSRKPPDREGVCRYYNLSGPFSNTMGSNSSLQINQSSHVNRFSLSENHGYCEGYFWKLEARNSIARMVAQLPNQRNSDGKLHSDIPQLMEGGKKHIPKDLASAAWVKAANELKSIKRVSSGDYKKDPMDSEMLLAETTAKNGQYHYGPTVLNDGIAYVESNGYIDSSLEFGNTSRERPLGTANGHLNMGRPGFIEKYTSSGSPTLDNNAIKSSMNHRRSSSTTAKSGQCQYDPMVVHEGSAYVESNGYIDSSLEFGNSSRERPVGTPNGQLNMGRPGSIKKDISSGLPILDSNATKSSMNHWRSSSPSKVTKANGSLSGELSRHKVEEKSVKPLNGSFTDEEQGFHRIDSLKRLACIYDKVLVVDNIYMARKTVRMLKDRYRHRVYACDTEVAKIDVKRETPVDHGEIICFSIYSEPELNFGDGKSCIWVDVLAGGGKSILAEFAPFFEDSSIKKVWHNYSFDNHILENYGLKVSGFHADTMHMARLWDSSRRTVGGYSLEALTGDLRVCHDKNLIGKVSMKTIFGRRKVKKDGSEGKILAIPAVEDLQREDRILWICYSAFDSISTLKLYESLKCKLLQEEWKVDGHKKGSMFEFYEKYWRPFGELLVRMETEGMLVDRAYLAEIEKVARAEQQTAANRFRNWASKYCPDAKYMNVGSDAQLRQLFFGGILNSKDLNESLPVERDFKVPNVENIIEEGKKTPSKFRNIKLHSLGPVLQTEMYTATGWPSVSIDALKTLAGKVSSEFDFAGEASELQSDDIIENSPGVSETKGGTTEGRDSAYGTAYDAFGKGQKGKEACHAIAALCEVCAIDSLVSNFILPLQGGHISGKRGRIHCSLNINTETGRLSARRPNLQNQPALEKDRYKIRQAFIAVPGNSLIVADYGQLELRILAHLANCKSMLAAFEAGGDFHSRTAMNMYPHIREAVEKKHVLLEWHPQPGEVKPPVPLLKDAFASERRKAKMLNFSIAYGKTPVGLARDWKVSVNEAKETVDLWYNERQEVRDWQEERKKEARKDSRVHTLLGRARHFPSMDSVSSYQKGHIERAAINTPVQGSAADVAMCAMLEISNNARLKELGWRLLLQVHDEVILEGPAESAEEAKAIVVKCMSKPFDGENFLRVDLSVDAKCAQNWYAAK